MGEIANGRYGEELENSMSEDVLKNGWSGLCDQSRERLIGIQSKLIGRTIWGVGAMEDCIVDMARWTEAPSSDEIAHPTESHAIAQRRRNKWRMGERCKDRE